MKLYNIIAMNNCKNSLNFNKNKNLFNFLTVFEVTLGTSTSSTWRTFGGPNFFILIAFISVNANAEDLILAALIFLNF